MPFNGSGTFTLVTGNPVVTGTVISSTVQNNTMADVANGLTGCVTRTGQSTALANLPMGGFKHTGAASGASTGEYLVYGQTGANLSSLTVGTLNTTGNANINGNVTIGDAATDALTINPNAVTWAGTPVAHTGQHSFASGVGVGNASNANPNILDWYEEGSFTPVLRFGGASTGITYSLNRGGSFTRIGNRVFFSLILELTNKGSAVGVADITGLPYAAISSVVTTYPMAMTANNMSGVTEAYEPVVTTGASRINLLQHGATSPADLTNTNFTNTSVIHIQGQYCPA